MRRSVALLVLFISVLSVQSQIHAQITSNVAEEYRARGFEEQQKGKYRNALVHYSKALSLGLEDPVVYNDIGVIYEQLNLPQRAEEYYHQAIAFNSGYLPPYTNLAYLYKARGDKEGALKYFRERYERAAADDPWKTRVLEEIYILDPGLKEDLIEKHAQLLNRELVEKAHTDFQLQIIRSDKHFQQGQQLLIEKQFDEAIAEFNLALALTPNNPKLLQARDQAEYQRTLDRLRQRTNDAMAKLDQGDMESAKEEFQEILATFPVTPNP